MSVMQKVEAAGLRDARKQFERLRREMLAAFTAALASGMHATEAAAEVESTASAMRQLAALRNGR